MRTFPKIFVPVLDHRVRLLLSAAAALLTYHLVPHPVRPQIRLLLAWDIGVLVLLAMICLMMCACDTEETFRRAQKAEPSNLTTLIVIVIVSVATLVGVALMVDDGQNWKAVSANVHLGLCTVAIFSAWFLLHTFFAIHYARVYYDELDEGDASEVPFKKGLDFPGGDLVDYWDFMYYSFTIGMCYQTSDISVMSTAMRRMTLVHSIVGFVFVATIIGLVVNVVSNLM